MDTSSISGGGRKQPITDKVGFDRRTFHRNSGCSLPPAFLTRVHGAGVGGGRQGACLHEAFGLLELLWAEMYPPKFVC